MFADAFRALEFRHLAPIAPHTGRYINTRESSRGWEGTCFELTKTILTMLGVEDPGDAVPAVA